MSDVYTALRRTVRSFGIISNVDHATRNARREQYELARVIAQVDALEARLRVTASAEPDVAGGATGPGRAA